MNVLIVGGTRFIGPCVVRQLVARGHHVTVYHRGETEHDVPAFVRHVHDRAAGIPVLAFPPQVFTPAPDVVIHMIPMGARDARAAVTAVRGRARRIVAMSSGDVYQAYGRFIGLESGAVERGLLDESAPLRTVFYPHRREAASSDDWRYWYDKIFVEREVFLEPELEGVVLRLPKVYGPGDNADFATVTNARAFPHWRWTHGYVENVAAAIALAAEHPSAAGRVYNVGERTTPTVAERLQQLAIHPAAPPAPFPGCYEHDIAYDTRRIRDELGFEEIVPYEEGLRRTLASVKQPPSATRR